MQDAWNTTGTMPGNDAGETVSRTIAHDSDYEGLIRCNRQGLVGTMISGYIHEINNPNNNILLASRLLADYWKGVAPLLTEYQQHHQEAICAGVPLAGIIESMPRIIAMIAEDVNRISRITTQMKPNLAVTAVGQTCDPNAVIKAVAESLKSMAARHTRNLRLNLTEDLPRVAVDFQQLQQVLTNLVCNALQSLPDRERGVTITSVRDDGEVVITVEDQGTGISPDKAGDVFKPFYTSRAESGSAGLGLFVSRLIIERCNGNLSLVSELGKGTVAVVRLPH